MSDQERLAKLLDDPYYVTNGIKGRFDSGDLKIEFGEENWREEWYRDPYFNVSIPVALDLAEKLPDVKVFNIYYWLGHDFHHVEFDYDGDTFIVQWYKIFTLHRKSDGKQHYFDSRSGRYDIPRWLRRGEHKISPHWGEGGGRLFNPFYKKEEKS